MTSESESRAGMGAGSSDLWAWRAGAVSALPILAMALPFGFVAGAFAAKIGLDFLQTFFLSAFVFAGASQMAAMELLNAGAPALVIVLTGLLVNLRFSMYAAALSPWLRGAGLRSRIAMSYLNVDNAFGAALIWYRANPHYSISERTAYYLGHSILTWFFWMTGSMVGYFAGAVAPASLSLEFVAPIAFLAYSLPLLTDRPSWLAAITAICASCLLRDVPFHLNIVLGGGAGMIAGYLADRALGLREAMEARGKEG